MISWSQFANIARDYGPFFFLIVAAIFLLWILWKLFPAVSSIVSVINLLKLLPAWMTGQDESNQRKEDALSDIKATIVDQGKVIEGTVEALKKHVEWGDRENTVLHRYIEAGDRQAAEWELIRDSWYDMTAKVNLLIHTANKIDAAQDTVIHEVKHNGGSSLKDATVRAETAVVRNNERLDNIEKLLTELINAKQA